MLPGFLMKISVHAFVCVRSDSKEWTVVEGGTLSSTGEVHFSLNSLPTSATGKHAVKSACPVPASRTSTTSLLGAGRGPTFLSLKSAYTNKGTKKRGKQRIWGLSLTVTWCYWITEPCLRTNEKNFPGESLSSALGEHLGDQCRVCHLPCLNDTPLLYHHSTVQPFHFTPHN